MKDQQRKKWPAFFLILSTLGLTACEYNELEKSINAFRCSQSDFEKLDRQFQRLLHQETDVLPANGRITKRWNESSSSLPGKRLRISDPDGKLFDLLDRLNRTIIQMCGQYDAWARKKAADQISDPVVRNVLLDETSALLNSNKPGSLLVECAHSYSAGLSVGQDLKARIVGPMNDFGVTGKAQYKLEDQRLVGRTDDCCEIELREAAWTQTLQCYQDKVGEFEAMTHVDWQIELGVFHSELQGQSTSPF